MKSKLGYWLKGFLLFLAGLWLGDFTHDWHGWSWGWGKYALLIFIVSGMFATVVLLWLQWREHHRHQ